MFGLLRQAPRRWVSSVFFRGTMPPRPEELEGLGAQGVRVGAVSAKEGVHWSVKLAHEAWGEAELTAPRGLPLPRKLVDLSPTLSDAERAELRAAGTGVSLAFKLRGEDPLRERKLALRYVRAVMGRDAVGAVDVESMRFWSRAELEEELAHEAELDVQSLYSLHAVRCGDGGGDATPRGEERGESIWLHTHGLAALGGFDLDVLNPPSPLDLDSGLGDVLRALAFRVVEGLVKPGDPRVQLAEPGGAVALIEAESFQREGPARERELRHDPDREHATKRAVVCDPLPWGPAKWFTKPRASRWLQAPMPEGVLVHYSQAATQLMARRARETYGVLRRLAQELQPLQAPTLVKLGYEVDGGAPDQREHLWFEVHHFHDGHVEATLLNQPHRIAALAPGQRGRHEVQRLTDWTLLTPAGRITPSHTVPLRRLRERWDEVMALVRQNEAPVSPT